MREPIKPEVIEAVEEFARPRILAPTDKQILRAFPQLSRSSVTRILRAARKRIELTQNGQSLE